MPLTVYSTVVPQNSSKSPSEVKKQDSVQEVPADQEEQKATSQVPEATSEDAKNMAENGTA